MSSTIHPSTLSPSRQRVLDLVDESSFTEFGSSVRAVDRLTDVFGDATPPTQTVPGDGVITGTARLEGRPVMIVAFDFSISGGTYGGAGAAKMRRAVETCEARGIPLVMLLEGGGHRVQDGISSRDYGTGDDIMLTLARLSGWVPVVAVMLGPGFGAPANFAACADFVVMLRGQATLGIAGPLMVKLSTGEDTDKETLGGASQQVDRNGVAHLAADTEEGALEAVRRYLSYLPGNSGAPGVVTHDVARTHPRAADLDHLVPTNPRRAWDARTAVDLIADEGSVLEIQPTYAQNVVTAFVRLGGRPVGILANQPRHLAGTLNVPAVEKAAHFVAVCDAFGLPIVSLIDVPGVLAGTAAESTGLARRSARLVAEMAHATVPRFSITVRKAYGLGYAAMGGGRLLGADLTLGWPTAEVSAMNIDAAVDIAFRKHLATATDRDEERARLVAIARAEVTAEAAAEAFGFDELVMPSRTRHVLIDALETMPVRTRPRARGLRMISPI